MRRLYSLLMWLATPFALGYFALRSLRDRRWRLGWATRLGLGGGSPCALVVHCASVGEVNAAAPLVRALLAHPGFTPILLTTFTPTGAARAHELLGGEIQVAHLPLDLPGATRRFLAVRRPRALVIVETELWPNLVRAAGNAGIPVILVNARLSERSVRGYRRWAGLMATTFAGLSRVLAQSGADASRFQACGMPAERITVTGNLKFDAPLPEGVHADGAALRTGWGAGRPVLVAGSTREGDEDILLPAFRTVLAAWPGALLVIAPRHPERFDRVADRLRDSGLPAARYSRGERPGSGTPALLLDTMGVLMPHYAAGDLCFVGGTLAPIGGHNLLEPAALGKPVLFGPHLDNVRDVSTALLAAGAGRLVTDEKTLAGAITELFGNRALRDRMGEAAGRLVASGQGALERTVSALETVLKT